MGHFKLKIGTGLTNVLEQSSLLLVLLHKGNYHLDRDKQENCGLKNASLWFN